MIAGARKGFDLGPFSRLPQLRHLSIEGKPKLTGWEGFRSDSLRILQLGWAPDTDVAARFPALQAWNIGSTPHVAPWRQLRLGRGGVRRSVRVRRPVGDKWLTEQPQVDDPAALHATRETFKRVAMRETRDRPTADRNPPAESPHTRRSC